MSTSNLPRLRHLRIGLFTLLILISAAMIACTSSASYEAHDVSGLMPDLSFKLTDENGEPVTAADYADARLTLLFFGYTNCPDVCPMTLSRLSAAISGLDESVRDDIVALFVSVDPKRDTPERLKKYTAHFGPWFVGLTGTQDELTRFTKAMRVAYGYGEPNENGFYLVSHSAAVFVFDDEQQVRLLINQQQTVDAITNDLKTLLDATA